VGLDERREFSTHRQYEDPTKEEAEPSAQRASHSLARCAAAPKLQI
jgi:hypothetical protein